MPDDTPKTTGRLIESDWIAAALVCREVAELPVDACEHMTPDDMLVTGDELQPIVAAAIAAERRRMIGIVTALWGADLMTTQAAMEGEITLDDAVRK